MTENPEPQGHSLTRTSDPGATPWRSILIGFGAFTVIALLLTAWRSSPSVEFDDHFRLPLMPDVPYETVPHVVCTVVMTFFGLIGVVQGIRGGWSTRSVLPVMIALSTALICIPEVFFDIMGAVYFPVSDTEPFGHAFTLMGRDMPVWIVAGWFGYGMFALFIYDAIAKRPSTKSLWKLLAVAGLSSAVFEEALLAAGVYHYYGNQPLVLFHLYPWWWLPANSIGVFLAAALAYRLRHGLQGWRSLWMVVITPMAVATVYGAVALPSWIAVNSDYPWLPTQLLGLSTIALGIAAFAMLLKYILGREPFDMNYVPDADDDFPLVKVSAV